MAKHQQALQIPSAQWFTDEDYAWDQNWSGRLKHDNLPDPTTPPTGWTANTWSQCTLSCGGGHRTRTAHPLRQPLGVPARK